MDMTLTIDYDVVFVGAGEVAPSDEALLSTGFISSKNAGMIRGLAPGSRTKIAVAAPTNVF